MLRGPISPSRAKDYDKCDIDPSLTYHLMVFVSFDQTEMSLLIRTLTIDILGNLQRQFRVQKLRQVRSVPQVDPLAVHEWARVLLLVYAITLDNPVKPLGAGDGRAEPDLLVGGLFVEDVGADCGNGDVEHTSLGDGQYMILVGRKHFEIREEYSRGNRIEYR